MTTTAPRNLFGIHSILLYNRTTGIPYGPPLKVLASGGVDLPADFEDLTGGSERFVLASEPKVITPEMKITTKDYADYLYEIFMGATVTRNAAEATGNVSGLANFNGTSVVDATTGIDSIAVKASEEGDLKFGVYTIVVKSANTINVSVSTDIDFRKGTSVSYQNDDLEIFETDITVPDSSGTVDLPGLGLTITAGTGTMTMTVGDTAQFSVRPVNKGSSVIDIGDAGTNFPEFGAIVYAQKRGSGEMFEIECYRCIGAGLPHNFEEKVFAQAELTVKVLKDFAIDRVMRIRAIS